MGHGRSGERQRTTCQEAFLPAVVASLLSTTTWYRLSPTSVRDSGLVQSADCHKTLSQSFASWAIMKGWTRWSTLFYTDCKNKYQATKFQIAYKAPGVLRYSKITILGLSPNQGILTPTVNETDSPSAGRDNHWSNGRRLPRDPDCITALTGHFTLKHARRVSNKHHGWNVYQNTIFTNNNCSILTFNAIYRP